MLPEFRDHHDPEQKSEYSVQVVAQQARNADHANDQG
jgi:hypothetical protein